MDHTESDVVFATPNQANGSAAIVQQGNAFRIEVVDEARFSLDKLGPIKHNYHLHPLMQMERLEQLAKTLVATDQCRFIARNTTVSSIFHH